MFLLLALLLLIFLPSPWNLAAGLACAVAGGLEVLYWERRMRGRRVRTGAEGLVGATGEVMKTLEPLGQIRVHGELWEAHSPTPLGRGARVRVVSVDDLTLEVAPADEGSAGAARTTAAMLTIAGLFLLGGCGGNDEPSASETYANGVCSSLSTWVSDVQDTVKSLGDQGLAVDREDIQSAVNDVDGATQDLVDDLDGLGAPDTEDGAQAKNELEDLATELNRQIDTVQQAIDSGTGAAAIAGTVTTALAQAASAAQTTWEKLQNLDPAGELRDAFENSDDCKSLQDQLEETGSG